jgi:O-antigen/teichoic acid export membrane protein
MIRKLLSRPAFLFGADGSYLFSSSIRYSPRSWSNFFHLIGSQGAIMAVGLASTMVWTRFVSKDTYGQYQLVFALITMVASLSLNGLTESASLSAAKSLDGNLGPIVKLKLKTDSLGSLILLGAALFYGRTRPILGFGLVIAAVLYPFLFLQNIWICWLSAKEHLKRLALLQVLEPVISLLVLGVLVFALRAGLLSFLAAMLLETALFNLFVIRSLFGSRRNENHDSSVVHYGLQMSWIGWLGSLGATDKLIIDHYLSPAIVATYGIVLYFPSQMRLLFVTFSRLLSKGIYGADTVTGAWEYLKPKLFPIQMIFLSIGVMGFFLFPVLIPALFSERYRDAVPYARWLWLWWGFTGPLGFIGVTLLAQRKRKAMLIHSIGYPLLLCTASLLMIPRYGLWGAVVSSMVTSTLFSGFHFFVFRYYLGAERASQLN